MTNINLKSSEADDALESVEKMTSVGYRRALKPRWHGAEIVAIGFALYALENPGNSLGLFVALGLVLFLGSSRDKIGASGKELPDRKTGLWALAGICVLLLTLFFGGIIVRRAFDSAWMPLVTGLIAGITAFLLAESERRYYIDKAKGGSAND